MSRIQGILGNQPVKAGQDRYDPMTQVGKCLVQPMTSSRCHGKATANHASLVRTVACASNRLPVEQRA